MKKRYSNPTQRRRMFREEFRAALEQLQLTKEEFGDLVGSRPQRVAMWLRGEEPPPPWVPLVCSLMTLEGGPEMAQQVLDFYTVEEP